MILQQIDWLIIASFFIISVAIGLWVAGRAGKDSSEFFLSGRHMPWYLLGTSMVATTFSIDTPNLVADIVRQNGVAGNWVWWAFLLTGMLTVFVYARLWRRSNVMTDVEFYELRYSGKPAAFLRGFRAIYLGVFFNIVVMAAVTLAVIKFGAVMLNFTPLQTVAIAGGVTVIYSSLGGLLGVLLTDFILFIISMTGAVIAAYYAVNSPVVGGLAEMLSKPEVMERLSFLPDFSNTDLLMTVLVIPFAVQWWSVWYPGAEPGGGGYIAQRMLAAKNERHAVGAALFFNVAHYAIRPWPWILVSLASIIAFPSLADIQARFPEISTQFIGHDLAYPAMLTFIPNGMLGLVLASLIAAYMSTISTSLNWGSSYVVNDFYKRFVKPQASEKHLVLVGRLSTLFMMIVASSLALLLESSLQAFNILMQIGAGTGLLFILRWFWWRINAYSELTAMVVSFAMALLLLVLRNANLAKVEVLVQSGMTRSDALAQVPILKSWEELVVGVAVTTVSWVLVTFFTKPADTQVLESFCRLVQPGGPGWRCITVAQRPVSEDKQMAHGKWNLPLGILCMVAGCFAVYGALFSVGYWIYSKPYPALVLMVIATVSAIFLQRTWRKVTTG
jgi:Na+/proline symporter